ncbi:hypothetical protein EMWEY_00041750 [Eimeria maxima]|uniref:Uncharacterized protein n=1 Tax=Eimeria maxima TaxID=5804 RepID=U6MGA7_EIMMA|nr:hypothetical protein EMWEY_00041750 [Eimeria maxima]CDJ61504.1 hypothetical protein EMWEY_00041750 [Eimeria maxima]
MPGGPVGRPPFGGGTWPPFRPGSGLPISPGGRPPFDAGTPRPPSGTEPGQPGSTDTQPPYRPSIHRPCGTGTWPPFGLGRRPPCSYVVKPPHPPGGIPPYVQGPEKPQFDQEGSAPGYGLGSEGPGCGPGNALSGKYSYNGTPECNPTKGTGPQLAIDKGRPEYRQESRGPEYNTNVNGIANRPVMGWSQYNSGIGGNMHNTGSKFPKRPMFGPSRMPPFAPIPGPGGGDPLLFSSQFPLLVSGTRSTPSIRSPMFTGPLLMPYLRGLQSLAIAEPTNEARDLEPRSQPGGGGAQIAATVGSG